MTFYAKELVGLLAIGNDGSPLPEDWVKGWSDRGWKLMLWGQNGKSHTLQFSYPSVLSTKSMLIEGNTQAHLFMRGRFALRNPQGEVVYNGSRANALGELE